MSDDQFRLAKADSSRIDVLDLSTGALFTFVIADRKISHVIGNEKNPLDQTRRNQALAFAEAEARKQGFID